MGGTFELSNGKAGKFHFSLLAANRRVVLSSEAYNSRSAALAGIASVRKNATVRERFERRTAKNGKTYSSSSQTTARSSDKARCTLTRHHAIRASTQ